jgi:TonB dependent receptor/CarboxypepD_reg-like domain/TonB-dependent Receptor Plug Domain
MIGIFINRALRYLPVFQKISLRLIEGSRSSGSLINRLIFLSSLATLPAFAQTRAISGTITDIKSNLPIEGVTVVLLPDNLTTISNSAGNFSFHPVSQPTGIRVSAIGYGPESISLNEFQQQKNKIVLEPSTLELSSVTISSKAGEEFKAIGKIDISLRDISNSQEVLRLVPGLFIGQHQGGGKAEQIFLRGFDCDHGTDISLNTDGMPVNLVSHAHGQGYADSHFIIPETIGTVDFKKGPYYAEKGDFCTSGYVDFHTLNAIPENTIKLEGGMFHTFRILGMFNLLGEKAKTMQQSWYAAGEYRYTDSYFDNPQHFNRLNFFTKYYGRISPNTWLGFSASSFYSRWNASGQIPERAVSEGIIGFYGALDPNEGGATSRTNVNAQTLTTLRNGDVIKNHLYYSYYAFNLLSNFTFYLVDTVNGDEIRQQETRNMFGYKSSYEHIGYLGSARFSTEAGLQFREDVTHHSGLAHMKDQFTTLQEIKLGNITEGAAGAFLNETLKWNDHFSINAGLRFDQFYYAYTNKLASDTVFAGTGTYRVNDHSLNPKMSFYYHQNDNLEFYLSLGKGFHSNDARSVVAEKADYSLPAAYGADLGTVFKPIPGLIINAAVWIITLDQEFVYGGDGGSVEFSGKTRRAGFDFSARYQPLPFLFLDMDLNYAHGRAVHDPKGQNFIPLAPVWTSTGGITYSKQTGFNGSLRYRYMGERPANTDNSLTASGYFVTDFVLNYTRKNYEIGLIINNVLNTKWKETQFDTLTRLKGEKAPVDEICFTPGTQLAARLSCSIFFK